MIRLIARIDSRNLNHIKTVRCEGVQVVRPVIKSLQMFSQGANEHDELIVIDNVASLYGVSNWLTKFSQDHHYVPLPMAIGGGLNSIESATRTLSLGADKLVVNTHAISDPDFLSRLSDKFGRQALILQIDSRHIDNDYYCFTHGARELSKYSVSDWLKTAQDYGVGEIFVTSIDSEGTPKPFPQDLAEIVASSTSLPIIISGGIRSPHLVSQMFDQFDIQAFCFSSLTNKLNINLLDFRKTLLSMGIPVRLP